MTAQPTGGTPAYSFLWSTGATTASIANQPAGTYSVTVNDMNGCTATASITITQFQAMQVTITGAEIVCGESNAGTAGVLVTGGTGPYTFLWNTGANSESVDGLGTGTYSVTVTDLNGCTSSAEIGILVVDDFQASITPRDLLCLGDNSGSAVINAGGGGMPYTYLWSNGVTGPEAANLSAGMYAATVTDANGCVLSLHTIVQQPALLQVSATAGNVSCAGHNNGTAIATATGGTAPYEYLWSNNQTGSTLTALAAGTYTVTVFDVNNCSATTTVQIVQPASFTVAINGTGPACAGASTGTATATAIGGVGPYSYQWNNGMTGPTRNGLPAGTYSVKSDFEVVSRIAAGKSNREIVQELHATPARIASRIQAIYKRLKISRRSEATSCFVRWRERLPRSMPNGPRSSRARSGDILTTTAHAAVGNSVIPRRWNSS